MTERTSRKATTRRPCGAGRSLGGWALVFCAVMSPLVGRAEQRQGTATRAVPSLSGLWDAATLTPLERPSGSVTISEEDARRIETTRAAARLKLAEPSDPNRPAPPVGGDGSTGAAGNVGGYNDFWLDPGDRLGVINGERRTSIVVDPPNGRQPPRVPGKQSMLSLAAQVLVTDPLDVILKRGQAAYDNPEDRPLAERCLIGYGSTAGPPALPVLYNNFKQIVQTRDHVVIVNEMIHDARIVRLNQPHAPPNIRKWLGDSVGHYEGDTLVVETTNFTDRTRFAQSTRELKVTERFRRLDAKTLLYRFTVEDPNTWTRPWTGEYTWRAAEPDEQMYEYACHEGNEALGNILRGARAAEQKE